MSFNKFDRAKLYHYFLESDGISRNTFTAIFKKYIDLFVWNTNNEFYTIVTSFSNILMGVLGILLSQETDITPYKVNMCIDFTLITVLLDNYLDTDNLSLPEKLKRVKILRNILYKNKAPKSKNKGIIFLFYIYEKYKNNSSFVDNLKRAFEAEVNTFHLQYRKGLSRIQLTKIAEKKGAETIILFKSMMGLKIYPTDYTLGYIIQIADDVSDIDEDLKSNINTIAIHVLKSEGTVDSLFYSIMVAFKNIKEDNNILIKTLLFYFVCYVMYNSNYVSSSIKHIIKPYTFYINKKRIEEIFGEKIFISLNK